MEDSIFIQNDEFLIRATMDKKSKYQFKKTCVNVSVKKNEIRLAVVRNKVKRQIRSIVNNFKKELYWIKDYSDLRLIVFPKKNFLLNSFEDNCLFFQHLLAPLKEKVCKKWKKM